MRQAALIAVEECCASRFEAKQELRTRQRAAAVPSVQRQKIEKVMQNDAK